MPTPSSPSKSAFCSLYSLDHHEPLYATAMPTRFFFLLEYPFPWGNRAFEESDIAEEVKRHLKAMTKEIPESKLLLIKRGNRARKEFNFYFAIAGEEQPALYAFRFHQYAQLLDLDWAKLVEGGDANLEERRAGKHLLLVCTNGKRDLCCAKFGLPTLRAATEYLSRDPNWEVWQSSHVGGHRFAPNVLALPWGLLFGRVFPPEVGSLIEDLKNKQVSLHLLRGRTCWEAHVQAAEAHLRRKTEEYKIDAYRLTSTSQLAPDRWEVRFSETSGNRKHTLTIQREAESEQVFESCQFDKTTPIVNYVLMHHSWEETSPNA